MEAPEQPLPNSDSFVIAIPPVEVDVLEKTRKTSHCQSSSFKTGFCNLWAWRNFIIFVLTPVILSPLVFVFENDAKLKEPMRCAFVLSIMIVFWATEVIPISVTSLIPMVLCPLLQLEKSINLAPLYLDDTNMAIVASILVVKAFEEANLHKRFAFGVIQVVGVQPRWLLLGLMVVAWFSSMLLSNAMAATLVIPVVTEIVAELRAALLENAKAKQIHQNQSVSSIDSSEFPRITHFSVAGQHLNVRPAMRGLLRYENMLVLGVAYSCSIGASATLLGTAENLIITNEITEVYHEHGCGSYNPVSFASWLIWGLPGAILFVPIAWLWLQIYYMGFRYTFGLKLKQPTYIHEHKDQVYTIICEMRKGLKPMGSRQWIVLLHILAMVLLFFTRAITTEPLIGWEIIAPGFVRESTVACFIAILLFAFPVSLPKKRKGRYRMRRPKRAIRWKDEDGGRAFNIVMLIGGGLAASDVAITSGLAQIIADLIYEAIHQLDEVLSVALLIIFVVFLTELVSNAASVHFLLPVLAELAEHQSRSPLLYMLPTALASSFAFMLPIATPPNAVAYSLSESLCASDMMRVGFVMNLLGIGVILMATNTWGQAYFEFYQPPWQFDIASNKTYCHSVWSHEDVMASIIH